MMTGDQYKTSLNDGRATYFEGRRVDDLPAHPILGQCVDVVAQNYDAAYSPNASATNALMAVPKSGEELRAMIPELHKAGMMAHVTHTSIMTLMTAAGKMSDVKSEYIDRMYAWVDDAQKRDIRVTQCITDAKGDRSRPPHLQDDPDAYTRVIERNKDGVVIRGAKLHITGASLGHELMTIPTKAMKGNEEDYAIACMVPVNSPGVKIVNTTYAPRHEDARAFPVSSKYHYPEGFVIFDDVFVPKERIFLDGETPYAAIFAHSLGLWERLGGLSGMADGADQLVGFAQLIAEANGLASVGHIKEKISEMIIHATLVRAALEAAVAHCKSGPQGAVFPDELYTNAGKYHAAASYSMMVRHLHDIGGGSILTAPSVSDLENPETGNLIKKYMRTMDGVDGEYRTRLFHAIRDLTADAYGGWRLVTNIQAGGGLYAQRIVTRKHYDLEKAKRMALAAAGMDESDVH
ncbi:MAG TPA: 4-hydroxyphenylacetate 3-hydroxylase N-terminal domain-containing protein [Thermoanaerobaculia bacterium]|nr:4-hydroxyphenylacetate 3-hydroxylase N-terminal domain-containing protein [Thermoanaerobaculia bacterium]